MIQKGIINLSVALARLRPVSRWLNSQQQKIGVIFYSLENICEFRNFISLFIESGSVTG
jgi:hypothetical protein